MSSSIIKSRGSRWCFACREATRDTYARSRTRVVLQFYYVDYDPRVLLYRTPTTLPPHEIYTIWISLLLRVRTNKSCKILCRALQILFCVDLFNWFINPFKPLSFIRKVLTAYYLLGLLQHTKVVNLWTNFCIGSYFMLKKISNI